MSTAWSTSPISTGRRSGEEAIKDYKKGDHVKAQVLDVDIEKERISLGIKQVGGDPMEQICRHQEGRHGHLRESSAFRKTALMSRSPERK